MAKRRQLTKMTSKYREMMRRLVCGQSPQIIKRELRISDSHYSYITGSDLFKAELHKMETDIKDRMVEQLATIRSVDPVTRLFQEHAEEAAHTDIDLMRNGSEKVRQLSAWDILDRAGYKPKEHYIAEGTIAIQGKTLQNIEQALEDIREEDIIDVEYETEDDGNGHKQLTYANEGRPDTENGGVGEA